MQKLLVVSLLLVTLSSCTFPWTQKDESFSGLYKAHIESSISGFEDISNILGLNRHEQITGTIVSNVIVPGIFSGSLNSDYSGLIDGRNSESVMKNVKVLFTSLLSSGSLSADEIGLISHTAESYVSYKNITSVGVIPDAVATVLKKYENTWLNITQQSQAEMSAEELMGYNIGKNLFTKSLVDIEKYATEYIFWKETADLGMSGSIHMWSVELDRTNILELAKRLSLDLAGTGMTTENADAIQKNLDTISFSGKLGFDPKDPRISILDGTLSLSGVILSEITLVKNADNGMVRFVNPEQKAAFVINYSKKEGKYSFDGGVTQEGIEMGKMTGYIEMNGHKFHELALEASAQGMTVSFKHTQENGTFTGKLSAVVATLEWSGMTNDGKLTGLKMNGTTPVGSFNTELSSTGSDMIMGPLVVKSGEETLVSANLGLEFAREKFAFLIDVLSADFPAHFDISIGAKSEKSSKSVTIPTVTKSFQEFIDEIEALTPAEPLMDESSSLESMDTTGAPGSDMGTMDSSSMDTTTSSSLDTTTDSVGLPQ